MSSNAFLAGIFVYGLVMGLKLQAGKFLVVSLLLSITLLASLIAANKLLYPDDIIVFGDLVFISIVSLITYGMPAWLGFAIARKIVKAKHASAGDKEE